MEALLTLERAGKARWAAQGLPCMRLHQYQPASRLLCRVFSGNSGDDAGVKFFL